MENEFFSYLISRNKELKEALVEVYFNKKIIKIEHGKVMDDGEREFGKKFTTAPDAFKYLFERGLTADILVTLPLVGIPEFVDILGIPNAKFSNMMARARKGESVNPPIPEPIQRLRSTSIWTMKQALAYKEAYDFIWNQKNSKQD